MPHFFFDLSAPGRLDTDDCGVEFVHLEAAYLDICRAALEISVEMLHSRQDPSRFIFHIRDAHGRRLLDVPFREVLQPGAGVARSSVPRAVTAETVAATVARTQELKAELRAGFTAARETVRSARATLGRARSR